MRAAAMIKPQLLQQNIEADAILPRGVGEGFERRHRATDARHTAPQQGFGGGGMSIEQIGDRRVRVDLFRF